MAREKDDRLFIQLALDFANHPKIRPLSDKAFRILIEMFLWSADQGTDGFINAAMFRTFGTAKARGELQANDSRRPSVVKVEGGYQLHDYEKHNRLRQEIEELRRKRSEAGARGGRAKANAKQVLQQTGQQTGSNFYPDVRSQIDQDLTVHPESLTGSVEDDMSRLDPVIAAVVAATAKGGLRVSPLCAPSLIAFIDERRGSRSQPVKVPTRYYPDAIARSWPEVSKFIHEEGLASCP